MINKSIISLIIFFILNNIAFADTFVFETANIEILKENNQINAGKGKAFSSNNDLEINADKFKYLKKLDLLETNGNGKAIIKSKNLVIKFDNALFDQKNSTVDANGNIRISQTNKKIFIETEKIFYDQPNDLIKSSTKAILRVLDLTFLFTALMTILFFCIFFHFLFRTSSSGSDRSSFFVCWSMTSKNSRWRKFS